MENGFSLKLIATAALLVGATVAAVGTADVKEGFPRVPGEMIVKLRDGGLGAASVQPALQASLSALGDVRITEMNHLRTDQRLIRVKISDDQNLTAAMSALSANPDVEYAEPNFIYQAIRVPNDTDFSKLWGLRNEGQDDPGGQRGVPGADIGVTRVWEEGHLGSHEIVVAVIDTGVEWTHPDLAANLFTNTGEIAGNGIDDDGNGFIDDVHGFNFASDTFDSNDDHGHGTHCAGTIGAVGDNGLGVVGVNWNVRLMPIKFLTASGSGSLVDAVESINYATLMGVDIMSNSWGGGGFSRALEDSIKAAREAGILFVAAAGNDRGNNNDTRPTYPASYQVENVVSVAATDNHDAIASFSNIGPNSVHVAAPGVRIHSTVLNGGYSAFSGTSMATPHVAGVAALLRSVNSDWDYAEIKRRLIETSDPVRGLRRAVIARGRVNAHNALHGIIPPSEEPDESQWQTVEIEPIESAHPYENGEDYTLEVTHPGAKFIRVHFERVELEAGFDFVEIIQSTDDRREVIEAVSGTKQDYFSDYVAGDRALIRFRSDGSVNAWGFRIDSIQVVLE